MKPTLFNLKQKVFFKKSALASSFLAKVSFVFFWCFLLSGVIRAQVIQVTSDVGTGTSYNTATGYPAPYGHYFWSSHHQLFISPPELVAAGVAPGGTITTLAFNVFAKNTQTLLSNWEITVYATTLTDPLATGLVTTGMVSSGGPQITYNPIVGWNTHTITPFVWDGSSGLVIETCHSHALGYTQNASMYWTNTLPGSTVKTRWGATDSQINTCTSATGNTSTNTRQNVRIGWEGINCTGAPPSTASSNYTNVCGGAAAIVMIPQGTYTNIGYTYQWESSSTGVTGLFSSVPGATNSSMPTGTLGASMAYRAIVTCTNGPVTAISVPVVVNVGPPTISNAVPALPLICPGLTGSLSLNYDYSGLGVSYLWQESAINIVGPYTVVPAGTTPATSGTLSTYVSPPLTQTRYFQAVLSCTAAPSLSSISVPVAVNIAGTTTNSVPYDEGFEGVPVPNFMPNCSWSASNPTFVCQTYTVANTFNRIPANGSKFASFKASTAAGGDYFYTNGIQLEPGVTYSASVWYITDGGLNWSEFSLMLGTSQTPTGLQNLASATPGAIANTFYKSLSNTFNVTTSGLYYLVVKCVGSSGNYLSFDDLAITAPCSANSPTMAVTGSTAVCSGQPFLYSASGADSYLWTNNGATTSTVNLTLTGNANVTVIGTNGASGCTSTLSTYVTVHQSPPVSISVVSNNTSTYVCKGSSTNLLATGAGQGGNYSWSTGTTAAMVTVSPTIATTYTVVGTNVNGCSSSAVQQISVKPTPTVSVLSSANNICTKETASLTATGAQSYTWSSFNNYLIGAQVLVSPMVTTTYSVSGLDAFSCEGKSSITISVFECVGLNELGTSAVNINLYPNPNQGQFTLEFGTSDNRVIEVFDLAGRSVFATKSNDNKLVISANDLAPGIYTVKVQAGKSTSVLKFIKE